MEDGGELGAKKQRQAEQAMELFEQYDADDSALATAAAVADGRGLDAHARDDASSVAETETSATAARRAGRRRGALGRSSDDAAPAPEAP